MLADTFFSCHSTKAERTAQVPEASVSVDSNDQIDNKHLDLLSISLSSAKSTPNRQEMTTQPLNANMMCTPVTDEVSQVIPSSPPDPSYPVLARAFYNGQLAEINRDENGIYIRALYNGHAGLWGSLRRGSVQALDVKASYTYKQLSTAIEHHIPRQLTRPENYGVGAGAAMLRSPVFEKLVVAWEFYGNLEAYGETVIGEEEGECERLLKLMAMRGGRDILKVYYVDARKS